MLTWVTGIRKCAMQASKSSVKKRTATWLPSWHAVGETTLALRARESSALTHICLDVIGQLSDWACVLGHLTVRSVGGRYRLAAMGSQLQIRLAAQPTDKSRVSRALSSRSVLSMPIQAFRKTAGNLALAPNPRVTSKLRKKTRCGNQREIIPSRQSFLAVVRMLIGYVRVSKSDGTQTLAPQRDALLAAGVAPERIYEDLASGRSDARPGLAACLKALQPGNTLVIWKLDRLGRDLRHLVNTVEDLRVRGVGLKVLAGAGAQIDTTTANGRLAFGIFAAFAEFERELIAERTQAGLAAARARGRLGGRPRKMNRATLQMAMAAMADPKAVAAEVAKRLGLTTTTLYTYVNGDGSPKAAGQALLDGEPRGAGPKLSRSPQPAGAA